MKATLLPQLMALFRAQGYDGASLAEIAAATGLGKSSLYHHFPGGKAEMATAVLASLDEQLRPVLESLADDRPAGKQLEGLIAVLDAFYDGGRAACLLERLTASVDRAQFATPLKAAFVAIAGGFAEIARNAGHSKAQAKQRAEAAIVMLQGALVVAAGTQDPGVWRRAMGRMKGMIVD